MREERRAEWRGKGQFLNRHDRLVSGQSRPGALSSADTHERTRSERGGEGCVAEGGGE